MEEDLSPIILFVYNRPDHTRRVLNSLAQNPEAKNSLLIIYSDGFRADESMRSVENIKEVRKIINAEHRFSKVELVIQEVNKGLSASIIQGVTEVVNKYGRAIVLEDDILPSPGFLRYMNDAMDLYSEREEVGCIHAWNYPLDAGAYAQKTFFLKGADCWGWATWKRAWNLFNPKGQELLDEILDRGLDFEFERKGTHEFIRMLRDQINGLNDSWAIRWHASLFLNDKYCLHPVRPIIKNIGMDDTGVHTGRHEMVQNVTDQIGVEAIEIKESDWFFPAYLNYMRRTPETRTRRSGLKDRVKSLSPGPLLRLYRKLKSKPVVKLNWTGDYQSWPEAKADCEGYEKELILEKCKRSALQVRAGLFPYERDSVVFEKLDHNWPVLSALLTSALEHEGRLSVLDFGGSLGTLYAQNKPSLNSLKSLRWNIVEQAHFVACGRKYFESDELRFYSTPEECLNKDKPQVMILSGVLQYLEHPFQWIEKLVGLEIPTITIDRTAITESTRDILTRQSVPPEIYEASYPAWFFSKEKFLHAFGERYEVIAEFDDRYSEPVDLNGVQGSWKGFHLKKR